MKPNIPEEIRAAIAEFDTWQGEAWLNLNSSIAGVEVRQMTLRHFFFLDGIGSPYISGGQPQPEDLALFLWVLSPKYSTNPKERDKFCKEIFMLQIPEATKDIEKYITATFQDAEQNEEKDKQYACFIAYMVDLFAREYGWTIDEVMETPLRQLYQLCTTISERYTKQSGERYTKLRAIDMMEARALLEQARKQKNQRN